MSPFFKKYIYCYNIYFFNLGFKTEASLAYHHGNLSSPLEERDFCSTSVF